MWKKFDHVIPPDYKFILVRLIAKGESHIITAKLHKGFEEWHIRRPQSLRIDVISDAEISEYEWHEIPE